MWFPQHPSPPDSQTPPRALPDPHLLCSLSTFSLGQGSGSPQITPVCWALTLPTSSPAILLHLRPTAPWTSPLWWPKCPLLYNNLPHALIIMTTLSAQHLQHLNKTAYPFSSIAAGIQWTFIEFLLCDRIKEAFLNKCNNKKEKIIKEKKSISSSVIKI